MLNTIKSQLFFVLFVMIGLLFSEIILSRSTVKVFSDGLNLTQKQANKAQLVGQLEREILDLQRNVLIYKETASKSVLTRTHSLIDSIYEKLDTFEALEKNSASREEVHGYTETLRGHLKDYKDNFTQVEKGRTGRAILFTNEIELRITELIKKLNAQTNNVALNRAIQSLVGAEVEAVKYLLNTDYSHIENFKRHIVNLKQHLNQNTALSESSQQTFLTEVKTIEKSFNKLTQVTRGYVFLVNVVMSGSANEFLYITDTLTKLVNTDLEASNQQVMDDIAEFNFYTNVFFTITIIVGFFTAVYFIVRIVTPIQRITSLFERLSQGKTVTSIPALNRTDEIGQLAKAANVFRDTNNQTVELLNQSKLHNEEQQRTNKALEEEKQKAESATNSKSMFLANMSHEIRTPMNGIIGFVDLLKLTSLTKKQDQYVEHIGHSSNIMMSVINDILDFSKIEAGKLTIENIEFSPHELFQTLVQTVSPKAMERSLNLRLFVCPATPHKLLGDPTRISQILLNLCNNAIKFTEHGSVTIEVKYQTLPEPSFNMTVSDTGVGMTKEQLSHIFESFTQADGSTSRKFGGTGLGLSIVSNIVDLMGGNITSSSEVMKGSSFNVFLPLVSPVGDVENKWLESNPLSKKLYYVTESDGKLMPRPYWDEMALSPQFISNQELIDLIDLFEETHIVVFEVETITQFNKQKANIERLAKKQISFGFLTDTLSRKVVVSSSSKFNAPYIAHPISNKAFASFITEVSTNQGVTHSVESRLDASLHTFNGHILLVEDNKINQMVATTMLTTLGLTYDLAENGVEAVELAQKNKYDLVLMDIQMPVMDGYQATKTIRELGLTDLIICGLSANAMKSDFDKAFNAGMDNYLTKPLQLTDLNETFDKYLAS